MVLLVKNKCNNTDFLHKEKNSRLLRKLKKVAKETGSLEIWLPYLTKSVIHFNCEVAQLLTKYR